MSIILTGDARNVTSPLSATITALANNGSGAVRVTTSAPHLFGNADNVAVTTTATNGTFVITVIDATHFDLVGSTFTVTGTGTAKDLSLTPQILVPTDGDSFSQQLSGALSAVQALCDRTQYLRRQFFPTSQTITAVGTTSFTVPANCSLIDVDASGGGGGGGGGAGGGVNSGSNPVGACGGGGGGGARRRRNLIAVTPGTTYDMIIGDGGAGGAAVAGGAGNIIPGNPGADGNATYMQAHGGGAIYNFWEGGKGGSAGSTTTSDVSTQTSWTFSPGGQGPASGTLGAPFSQTYNNSLNGDTFKLVQRELLGPWPAGTGGYSVHDGGTAQTFAVQPGVAQEHGGGGSGTTGANAGSGAAASYGGAGGGGGGGGGFPGTNFLPNPGAGANGGAGNNSGVGSPGATGNPHENNTGAGGGGGGAGGQGSATVGGAGGAGGKGGSGVAIIYFIPGL